MPRIVHGTLTAATVATVTLDADYANVEVRNRGTDEIFFTVDGTDPTVEGADTEVVPGNSAHQVPALQRNTTDVKMISSGTPKYTVRGL
jgi:hypothetical protein